MLYFLKLTFLFSVGCVSGYALELFYRRIRHGKWINPGFLVGPCLPLYGSGLTLLYVLSSIDYSFIGNAVARDIFVIVVITLTMTLIELLTGLIFIRGLNVKLWDYSELKFNFMGIICPQFSLIWGAIGAAYYFLLHAPVSELIVWFTDNIYFSFFTGAFYGVFVVDAIYSFNVVARIKKWAKDKNVVVRYETLKLNVKERAEQLKEKVRFLFPFKGKRISEELENYAQKEAKTDL